MIQCIFSFEVQHRNGGTNFVDWRKGKQRSWILPSNRCVKMILAILVVNKGQPSYFICYCDCNHYGHRCWAYLDGYTMHLKCRLISPQNLCYRAMWAVWWARKACFYCQCLGKLWVGICGSFWALGWLGWWRRCVSNNYVFLIVLK